MTHPERPPAAGKAEPSAPAAGVPWPDEARRAAFERWAAAISPRHGLQLATLAPASADASFRRYLRVQCASGAPAASLIVMDAPPPHEDVRPFMQVAALIGAAGLNAPRVLEADVEHGFLLLTDLGRAPYLQALQAAHAQEANALMRDAIQALVRFQQAVPADALPLYGEPQLRSELELFPTWCVQREHGITWSDKQQASWQRVRSLLIEHALAQPTVAVHADWMPRNLMHCPGGFPGNPGILDFQDAVRGPIGYDIASLLRDAYLSWDEERELDWAVRWWDSARKAGLPVAADFGSQWQAIEWIGLQRHLRILGVFCRLKQRDGKPRYAEDLPRFLGYAQKVALRYRPLAPLLELLAPLSGNALDAGYTF
jgi:N-acetylmuramate 1-kinase